MMPHVILLGETVSRLTALDDLLVGYVACALGVLRYVQADLTQCVLIVFGAAGGGKLLGTG